MVNHAVFKLQRMVLHSLLHKYFPIIAQISKQNVLSVLVTQSMKMNRLNSCNGHLAVDIPMP